MLRKSYRNLEFVNSFAVPISSRRKKALGSDPFLFSLLSFCFPIRISELGPVQTGRPPAGRGGGWESESLRVFNTRQESGNGTRELRTGSRSVPSIWEQNPRLGPALAAIGRPSLSRGSDGCHNCSVRLSLPAPVQERPPCPNALPPELRPNALSPELIRSSASLRIRRRSSVWRIASIRPAKARVHSEPTASSLTSRP